MNKEERGSVVALPVVLGVAALVAWAGSQGGARIGGVPVYAVCFGLAFVMQWAAFIPAYLNQTEKFFDLTGSVTYISVTALAVALSGPPDARSVLLLALVGVWAVRLGSFLFRRIQRAGSDERFDDIKPSFWRFLLTWTLQGLWVSLTLAAALAAITSEAGTGIGWMGITGLVVWLAGFGLEVMADRQKKVFREKPENTGRFIDSGLWAWSRHPNYFGEIVLWVGVAMIAVPALRGWQWVTLISPVFVAILLTRISGIPMLEARADAKWGGQADYEAYKKRTSVLIPLPPGAGE